MKMNVSIAVMALVANSFAAGDKCNFDAKILAFEKRMDLVSLMRNAKKTVTQDDESPEIVFVMKESKPIKSGQFMGLEQTENFAFDNCRLAFVTMAKVDPKSDKEVSKARVFLRDDGNLKAACKVDGYGGNVYRMNPIEGTIEPNPECICYDRHSLERKFGKYGCLEDDEIEKMNAHNANAGGGMLGKIIRNGRRVDNNPSEE